MAFIAVVGAVVFLSCASARADSPDPIYGQHGDVVAWFSDDVIYDLKGDAKAFLSDGSVITYKGKYCGRLEDGWFRDKHGDAIAFFDDAGPSGPIKPIE